MNFKVHLVQENSRKKAGTKEQIPAFLLGKMQKNTPNQKNFQWLQIAENLVSAGGLIISKMSVTEAVFCKQINA